MRRFTGNDVVDLRDPLRREHFGRDGRADAHWLSRHLTPPENQLVSRATEPFHAFWRLFAAKEAAWKALAQAGVRIPHNAWRMLEVDEQTTEVACLPSGHRASIQFAADDEDKLHCVAALGDAGGIRSGLAALPRNSDASCFARDELLRALTVARGAGAAALAIVERGGIPRVLESGRPLSWSVSLSHAGRFVAYSFIAE